MRVTAIVPAAGEGSRFGGPVRKQFTSLGGLPIVSHTLKALVASDAIERVIVVVPPGEESAGRDALRAANVGIDTEVVIGGQERQDSVFNGLQRAKPDTDLVLIHDGVRPFVSRELIIACLEVARESGAAVAAVPVSDTIKRVAADGFIVETPERGELWAAQTPQVFGYTLLLRAHQAARSQRISATDDAMLVERIGVKIRVVRGSTENLKITNEDDLILAEWVMRRRMPR